MDKTTIQTLIDKVIGKKGLIRVPSWWMRKVLMQIVDWVQEGDDANRKKIERVDKKISTLETNVNTLETNVNILETNTNRKISTLETNVNTLETNVSTFETNTNRKISTLETYNFNNNNVLFELIETANPPSPIKFFTVKTRNGEGFVDVDGIKQTIPADSKMAIAFVNDFNFGRANEFYNYITFIGLTATNTSEMTDMSSMFNRLRSLTSLDLSSFNTSKVTDMSGMFSVCIVLTSLDLSSFNTSKVTDMDSMFYECQSLTSLNLSSFDTSAVTTMNNIFNLCPVLTSLILGPNFFKTPNVTGISFTSLTQWTNDTVVTSLVTNSYDRATAGLSTMTLQLSANTKAALTDEQKAAITAKGYTIA